MGGPSEGSTPKRRHAFQNKTPGRKVQFYARHIQHVTKNQNKLQAWCSYKGWGKSIPRAHWWGLHKKLAAKVIIKSYTMIYY